MTEDTSSRPWTTAEPDRDPARPMPMEWDIYADRVLSDYFALLANDPEEDAVQEFLELHPSMIPGGSGDIGPGGHHGSTMGVVFRRPRLSGAGRDVEPDFMWVTRSSGLITPILIEIEKPSKRWFRKDGRPTAEFTSAHDQLNDWRSWFARTGNDELVRQQFIFTSEKFNDRPIEPHFVLIFGREGEFEFGRVHSNPDQLRHKRDSQRGLNEHFRSFDSLRPRYDHRMTITASMTALGPRPFAFSPIYGTSTSIGEGASILGDPASALARSVMMTDERRTYVEQRWKHWAEEYVNGQSDPGAIKGRQMGFE